MSEIDPAVQDKASRQSAAPPAGAGAQPNPARDTSIREQAAA